MENNVYIYCGLLQNTCLNTEENKIVFQNSVYFNHLKILNEYLTVY